MTSPHQSWPTLATDYPADRKGDDATDRQIQELFGTPKSTPPLTPAPTPEPSPAPPSSPTFYPAAIDDSVGQGSVTIFPATMTIKRAGEE